MEKYIRTLSKLGLNEKESTVYLALHHLGEATAYKIALYSGLKRPTVYVILDELRKKELVTKIPFAKGQVFKVKPLQTFMEAQQKALDDGLRLADVLDRSGPVTTSLVYHFEGMDGVSQAVTYYADKLHNGRSSAILGHLSDDKLMSVFTEWHELAKQSQNFSFRALISGEHLEKNFSALKEFSETGGYVTTKVLQNTHLPYDFSFEVFEKENRPLFLRIIADKDLQATIIETPVVSAAFLQLFDSLWEESEAVDW